MEHAKNNPTEGEPAIALGRGAGAAKLLGDDASADFIWQKLEELKPGSTNLAKMPTLEEFFEGYKANDGNFSAFVDKNNFPVNGEAFSNATGSFARALAQMSERQPAIVAGETNWAYDWGAKALRAAGFEKAAEIVSGAPDSVLDKNWVNNLGGRSGREIE